MVAPGKKVVLTQIIAFSMNALSSDPEAHVLLILALLEDEEESEGKSSGGELFWESYTRSKMVCAVRNG